MDMTEIILSLLSKKHELFKEFEDTAQQIVNSDFENLEVLFEKTEQIKKKIDELSQQLTKVACDSPLMIDAINNSVDASSLSQENLKIFKASQNNFVIINRILKLQPLINEKMQWEKNRLQNKLKTLESNRKVNKVLQNTVVKNESGTLLNIKK